PLLEPVKRDFPLPLLEVGTHAFQDLIEHAHAVSLSTRVGCPAPPIVAGALRPPACPPGCRPPAGTGRAGSVVSGRRGSRLLGLAGRGHRVRAAAGTIGEI